MAIFSCLLRMITKGTRVARRVQWVVRQEVEEEEEEGEEDQEEQEDKNGHLFDLVLLDSLVKVHLQCYKGWEWVCYLQLRQS